MGALLGSGWRLLYAPVYVSRTGADQFRQIVTVLLLQWEECIVAKYKDVNI